MTLLQGALIFMAAAFFAAFVVSKINLDDIEVEDWFNV